MKNLYNYLNDLINLNIINKIKFKKCQIQLQMKMSN